MRLHLLKERQSDGYILRDSSRETYRHSCDALRDDLIIMPILLPPEYPLFSDFPRLTTPCPIATLLQLLLWN